MNAMSQLKAAFESVLAEFNNSRAMQRISRGDFTLAHYKAYLRETYFYIRENAQMQSLACTYFRGSDRKFIKTFLRHALSEAGHEQWALDDLARLGEGVKNIPMMNPLPNTRAVNAVEFYQVCTQNPIGCLGYIFFFEFLPTSSGEEYMQFLRSLGVPKEAMTFIEKHVEIDAKHNLLMEKYADGMLQNQADIDSVIYSMRTAGKLYADMLLAAFEDADKPVNWGVNSEEQKRSGIQCSDDLDALAVY